MCRLLGYASSKATTFDQVVGENFDQFINLADDHSDGWGIAALSENQAQLYKEPLAATKSTTFNQQLLKNKSASALLHFRWATEGMAVNQNNTHPFTHQDISFIHNGSITPSDCLDHLIDKKYLALAQGTTDSERYFLYLLTQIEKLGFISGVKSALSYLKANCQYSSINMMMTNNQYFLAACIYHQDKIPNRFKDDLDYYHLKYLKTPDQVVVGSTGWSQPGWQDLPNNHLLVFEKESKKLDIQALG
jgi:predicted glutamine amidotransferase